MKRSIIFLFAGAVAASILAGCERVNEPWDSTGYFEQHRERTAEQSKALRDRTAHTQNEYERPSHQTES